MNAFEEENFERALASGFLPRLRIACMAMSLTGAILVALPIFLAAGAPRELPSLEAGAASLDFTLGILFLLQVLAFVLLFRIQGFWQRLAPVRPAQGGAWEAEALALAIERISLIRFGLGESICLLGGLGFYLAYQQGLLLLAPHLGLLGLLPLASIAWMLLHWPDEKKLRQVFLNS